jgi:hypothetical protein
MNERHIYDGRKMLGTVRERAEGDFVAVIDEMVIGPFHSIRAATDALMEITQRACA